jgi:hypothetical protein
MLLSFKKKLSKIYKFQHHYLKEIQQGIKSRVNQALPHPLQDAKSLSLNQSLPLDQDPEIGTIKRRKNKKKKSTQFDVVKTNQNPSRNKSHLKKCPQTAPKMNKGLYGELDRKIVLVQASHSKGINLRKAISNQRVVIRITTVKIIEEAIK